MAEATVSGQADFSTFQTAKNRKLTAPFVPYLAIASELLVLNVYSLIVYALRQGSTFYMLEQYIGATLMWSIMIIFLFRNFNLYSLENLNDLAKCIKPILLVYLITFSVMLFLAFLFKLSDDFSRTWVLAVFAGSTLLILATRGLISYYITKQCRLGALGSRVAIVGATSQAKQLVIRFASSNSKWYHIIGIFDDRKSRVETGIAEIPLLGDLTDLTRLVRSGVVQVIIIALPYSADERIISILSQLKELPVRILMTPDLMCYRTFSQGQEIYNNVYLPELTSVPGSGFQGFIKTTLDKIVALVTLGILMPLMAFIAVAIKCESRGPILFKQQRYGFNNGLIDVYKFRSMHYTPQTGEVVQAKRRDARVTKVGWILRRTSLDELPQLFNVLGGSMSLVGPRPHAIRHHEQYSRLIAGYDARHKVKPGITGLAQISGWRGETDTLDKMQGRAECDIAYIENWSLWLDFRILVLTAFVGWFHKNAY